MLFRSPSRSSPNVDVQTLDLYSLPVRPPPPLNQFQYLNHNPPLVQSSKSCQLTISPENVFAFSNTFCPRNATAPFRIATDALGQTGPRHAPTTCCFPPSGRCRPCKRAKRAYRVGKWSPAFLIPLRDRFFRLQPVCLPVFHFR